VCKSKSFYGIVRIFGFEENSHTWEENLKCKGGAAVFSKISWK